MNIKTTLRRIYRCRFIYLLIAPGILYFIIFSYIPMAGVSIAFMDFQPWVPLFENKWIGFKYLYLCGCEITQTTSHV